MKKLFIIILISLLIPIFVQAGIIDTIKSWFQKEPTLGFGVLPPFYSVDGYVILRNTNWDVGSTTAKIKGIYATTTNFVNLTVTSTSTLQGTTTAYSIIPASNNAYSLGLADNRWSKIWTTDLDAAGVFTLGGTVGSGGIDMSGNLITNIGNSATDFTAGGGLNLAGTFNASGTSFFQGDSTFYGAITANGLITGSNITLASTTNWNTAYGWNVPTNYVARNDWTTIDNYPTVCSGNNWVQGIGDTLTCNQIGFSNLSGAATDAQIPDTITIANNATTGTASMLSLTSIGTITTGGWNASTIGVGYGGTGLTSATAGYVLIGNSATALQATSTLFITSTGRVGVATTTPATTFGVYGTSTFMGGNVGIGTTTPQAMFSVNSASTNAFVVTSSGSVGIGTTAPSGLLHIIGRCKVGDTDNGNGTCTATFYPDAHPETTSVDGYVSTGTYTNPGVVWDTLVNHAGGGFVDDGTDATLYMPYFLSATTANQWRSLTRSITLFDTSPLSDDVLITSAILSVYGYDKQDGNNAAPTVNVYSSAPASNTALANGDFDSLGTTTFSTAITYANWSTSGYNDFILNAAGLAAITKTGVSKFGFRNPEYDIANSAPPWVSGVNSSLRAYTAEQGTGYKPKLAVTYSYFNTPSLFVGIDGNVGIGTTTPASILHIANPTATTTITIGTETSTGCIRMRDVIKANWIYFTASLTGGLATTSAGSCGF